MMVKVNEDLQKERNKCDFNVEELTNFLDGGVNETEKRKKIGKFECVLAKNKLCLLLFTFCGRFKVYLTYKLIHILNMNIYKYYFTTAFILYLTKMITFNDKTEE